MHVNWAVRECGVRAVTTDDRTSTTMDVGHVQPLRLLAVTFLPAYDVPPSFLVGLGSSRPARHSGVGSGVRETAGLHPALNPHAGLQPRDQRSLRGCRLRMGAWPLTPAHQPRELPAASV